MDRSKILFWGAVAAGVLLYFAPSWIARANHRQPVSIPADAETAIFAGGCFWCMESPFEKLDGVFAVESGYTGGTKTNPTYYEVCRGSTGHLEAVKVTYDPKKIGYEDLLEVFWRQINPTDAGGQFVDRGESYLSAIFVDGQPQKTLAERSKADLEASGRFDAPIRTTIREVTDFYRAEEYHQDYYVKNPINYRIYRYQSGRDQYLDEIWGTDRDYHPPAVTESKPRPPSETHSQREPSSGASHPN